MQAESSREFFITARSFAAPFVSDTSERYVEARSPREALEKFAKEYGHPCGLYAAECWENADAYHKRGKALAEYQSNELQARERATAGKGAYTLEKRGNVLLVDDLPIPVDDPREGSVL